MLTSVTLYNYTTFIKETLFDFKATNSKILNDTNVSNKVLKGAMFIGENASGKTKALNAITFLLDFLLENSDSNFVTFKSMYTKGIEFSLEYTFLVVDHEIKYKVEFVGNKVNTEKLFLDGVLIIDRIKSNGEINVTSEKRTVEVASDISILKQEYYKTKFDNHVVLNKWFSYLENSIYCNCLNSDIKVYNSKNKDQVVVHEYIQSNDAKVFNKFFNEINYNSEIVIDKKFGNSDDVFGLKSDEKVIGVRKKGSQIAIPLTIESTGNNIFVNLILPFIYITKHEGMLLVDEFSSGLHNELEEALIRYFFDNSKDSQLFFVSHSTNLLNTTILRPDQIYSFGFDAKKGAVIKRFSEENPRESQNLEKMYLGGVFDGKPTYNKKFKI